MKQILKSKVVTSRNEAEFETMVMDVVRQYQSEQLEVDIRYAYSAANQVFRYHSALVVGCQP